MRRSLASGAVAILIVSCSPGAGTITTRAETSTGAPTTASVTTVALPTTTAATPATPSSVYLFFEGYPTAPGPYLAPVARPIADDLDGTLVALLEGASEQESAAGLSSTIPAGTRLLGSEISAGVASVDLSVEFESGGGSLSMMGRVAQVVFTATRHEGVDAVRFMVEGAPLDVLGGEGLIIEGPQTRQDWAELTPPIMIDTPAWGSVVGEELTLSGTAVVDSGEFSYVIVDADGLIIHEGAAATSPGMRSDFEVVIDLGVAPHPGSGSLIVWEWAPDGSQQHVLQYPLTLSS